MAALNGDWRSSWALPRLCSDAIRSVEKFAICSQTAESIEQRDEI